MEQKNLEQENTAIETSNLDEVKELINRIADSYDLPTKEQVKKMQELTGMDWDDEELQMACCEYWSHNSLEETAYLMFHGDYPQVLDVDLIFWKYKPGVTLDDQTVYEKYRFGRGTLKALEALPLDEIIAKIKECFPDWQQDSDAEETGNEWRFNCPAQAEDWMDTHFLIFEYGRETDTGREHQMLRFCCHNMSEEQMNLISECMESFQCPLRIREDEEAEDEEDYEEED